VAEQENNGSLRIYARVFRNKEFSGIAQLFGKYMVCTIWNAAKTAAMSLQAYIDEEMSPTEAILNVGCIWIQDSGKPILSVILLAKTRKEYDKQNLPETEPRTFEWSNDPDVQKVNHFVEYVARKGQPELAPKWFKRNTLEAVRIRNEISVITVNINRPREEYPELSQFFVKGRENGQWLSLSRIHRGALAHPEKVSVFRCDFSADDNRKIVQVARYKRLLHDEVEYEGIVQYKQQHISIYFTSDNGYKHLLCPLPAHRLEDERVAVNTVLLGSSSTLYENTSYLIKEMLVYTNQVKQDFIDQGAIPLEAFQQLDFLTQEQKHYLSMQDDAVLYKMKAV
jgi:hypothetical protein